MKFKNTLTNEIIEEEKLVKEILENFFTEETLKSEDTEWVKTFEQMNNFVQALWFKNNGIPFPYVEIE